MTIWSKLLNAQIARSRKSTEHLTRVEQLIDAEIAARQSVTDEDIREAIEWLHVVDLEMYHKDYPNCLNLAMEALRAYRPQEPCELCEGKKYLSGSAFLEDGQIEPSIERGDFNYCPNCGRKIESED